MNSKLPAKDEPMGPPRKKSCQGRGMACPSATEKVFRILWNLGYLKNHFELLRAAFPKVSMFRNTPQIVARVERHPERFDSSKCSWDCMKLEEDYVVWGNIMEFVFMTFASMEVRVDTPEYLGACLDAWNASQGGSVPGRVANGSHPSFIVDALGRAWAKFEAWKPSLLFVGKPCHKGVLVTSTRFSGKGKTRLVNGAAGDFIFPIITCGQSTKPFTPTAYSNMVHYLSHTKYYIGRTLCLKYCTSATHVAKHTTATSRYVPRCTARRPPPPSHLQSPMSSAGFLHSNQPYIKMMMEGWKKELASIWREGTAVKPIFWFFHWTFNWQAFTTRFPLYLKTHDEFLDEDDVAAVNVLYGNLPRDVKMKFKAVAEQHTWRWHNAYCIDAEGGIRIGGLTLRKASWPHGAFQAQKALLVVLRNYARQLKLADWLGRTPASFVPWFEFERDGFEKGKALAKELGLLLGL
jgi:hypothetical protein